MKSKEFNQIVKEQLARCNDLLIAKGNEYAVDYDRLQNFKTGAAITGLTPEETLWGYLTKHLASLRDMIKAGKLEYNDVANEKITDSINYLILLKAILKEQCDG